MAVTNYHRPSPDVVVACTRTVLQSHGAPVDTVQDSNALLETPLTLAVTETGPRQSGPTHDETVVETGIMVVVQQTVEEESAQMVEVSRVHSTTRETAIDRECGRG